MLMKLPVGLKWAASSRMQYYIASRLLQTIPLLIGASILVFGLIRLLPGDAADALAGPDAPPELSQIVREQWGLDKPIVVQYGTWVSNMVKGDFGQSYISRQPVFELLAERIPATVELAVAALFIAVTVGISAGVFAAINHGTKIESLITVSTAVIVAVPGFWIGILAIYLFAQNLGWLPSGGRGSGVMSDPIEGLKYLLLPALIVSMNTAAVLSRVVKSSMLEVMREDYIRTAVSKGLNSRQVTMVHILRNAMVPVITIIAIQAGNLLGGAVITESVFAWPGVGRLLIISINARDYAVLQAVIVTLALVFVFVNLVADIIYALLDPRIRLGRSQG